LNKKALITGYKDYGFHSANPSHMHARFMPHIFNLAAVKPGMRVLDVGCGNGFTCGEFLKLGCSAVGIDLSESGIAVARRAFPEGRFEVMAAGDGLLEQLQEQPFDRVISTEVIEHLYSPRPYAKGSFKALKPGGRFICTTPYHGYLKNLVIALTNKWDRHADPLWDGGHIKLWSRKTLISLLAESGFTNFQFRGAGRLPYLWMTMVVSADKPDSIV
jgi:2-polyprenyl-6-hydroxyphenyl methylase/3-demethylubiquinone-9 3-methyltransferase